MTTDARVDAYIAKSATFAQPILAHLRDLVHKGCPHVGETIKWNSPFFTINGKPFCLMVAFKNHCRFEFWSWGARQLLPRTGKESNVGMSSTRQITSVKDLPSDKKMVGYVQQAAKIAAIEPKKISSGKKVKALKPALALHPDFAAALKKNKKASAALEAFSPSHRREYLEWINDAKRDETPASRIATAVTWLTPGQIPQLEVRADSRLHDALGRRVRPEKRCCARSGPTG